MHMEALLWLFLPVFVAGGSALLSYYIMQAKMEVALAKERESLAEARATITSQKVTMEERIRATEESTKRLAMDNFMQEIRVEERSYARESRSLTSSRKTMVMQERLFFRNIPLSNWIEHEMVLEEGLDLDQLPKESVFAAMGPAESRRPVAVGETRTPISIADGRMPAPVPASDGRLPISKLVNEFGPAPAKPQRENTSLIPAHVVAFGAQ
jgi:hypothetical protein